MKFEKVSFDAFKKDLIKCGIFENDEDNKIKEAYDNIQLPKRSTTGSCGYDFVTPMDVTIVSYKTTLIPTGIKVILEEGYFLMLCPRS
ncbi:MAG: deoxyuridine 5'-triphosphate nucleotidohydrolase, partial [Clostridia bacterium]|nr:deoxyuridine 5'-triphosphate nucleotidohydrolase [Clostridia bacterium]